MSKKHIALSAAALTTIVTAATFVVFTVAYSPVLRRLDDREYIGRMQDINRDIQNPWFLGSFMGAVFLLPLAAYLYRKSGASRQAAFLIAASALYIVGTFGVTSAVNVPLNEKLDKVSVATTSSTKLAHVRKDYESSWTAWHLVRTAASVAAAAAVLGAVFSTNKKKGK